MAPTKKSFELLKEISDRFEEEGFNEERKALFVESVRVDVASIFVSEVIVNKIRCSHEDEDRQGASFIDVVFTIRNPGTEFLLRAECYLFTSHILLTFDTPEILKSLSSTTQKVLSQFTRSGQYHFCAPLHQFI